MGLIFYLSSQAQSALPPLISGLDKLLHALEYAILGGLWIRALDNQFSRNSLATLKFLAFFVAVLYAASDEFHQKFVSGRSADFFDWLADSSGAALGSFVIFGRNRNREKKTDNGQDSRV